MKKEYIEKQAVEDMIENAHLISEGEYCGYCTEDIDINSIPVADVTTVVRCRDCKHYDGKWFCNICGIPSRRPYDFCSYGERKEG